MSTDERSRFYESAARAYCQAKQLDPDALVALPSPVVRSGPTTMLLTVQKMGPQWRLYADVFQNQFEMMQILAAIAASDPAGEKAAKADIVSVTRELPCLN